MRTVAQVRLLRRLAVIIGACAALFWALDLGLIAEQSTALPRWATPVLVVTTFGAPLVAAVLAPGLQLRGLRMLLIASALTSLAGSVLLIATLDPIPGGPQPWVVNAAAIGPASIAAVAPAFLAWGYTGLTVVAVVLARVVSADFLQWEPALQDGLFALMACALFVALARFVAAQSRKLDFDSELAESAAVRRSRAEASGRERARVDLLLHDTVLAALHLVAGAHDSTAPALRRQASDALAALQSRLDPDEASALPQRLRESVLTLDPSALLEYEPLLAIEGDLHGSGAPASPAASASIVGRARDASVVVPPVAVEALVDATCEAVRNAVRHAGPQSRTRVLVAYPPGGGVEVRVIDSGPGFAVGDIPENRLGVRRGILDRLERVPGCRAEIHSEVGHGTTVLLRWVPA